MPRTAKPSANLTSLKVVETTKPRDLQGDKKDKKKRVRFDMNASHIQTTQLLKKPKLSGGSTDAQHINRDPRTPLDHVRRWLTQASETELGNLANWLSRRRGSTAQNKPPGRGTSDTVEAKEPRVKKTISIDDVVQMEAILQPKPKL